MTSIGKEKWLRLNVEALADWFSRVAGTAPGARLLEFDGVIGAVSPAVAGRSVFNSVAYTDPAALEREHGNLAAAYAEAGCAWTVWVPENDPATARMLEGRGHTFDAQPRAMGMELAPAEAPDLSAFDWTDEGDFEEMCAINDAAYGWPAGTWRAGLGGPLEGSVLYLARVEDQPAATVVTVDHPGIATAPDCSVWCVGTLEAARGKGLATALMRQALFDAGSRGCATTTLQATKLGRPVYERVGYGDFGALQMWESRPHELSAAAQPRPAA
jgi:GNAT superfamily N-acetyltransferase